jgi:hypothetical protein
MAKQAAFYIPQNDDMESVLGAFTILRWPDKFKKAKPEQLQPILERAERLRNAYWYSRDYDKAQSGIETPLDIDFKMTKD